MTEAGLPYLVFEYVEGLEKEAESVLRRALDIHERVFGPEHQATAGSMYQLADPIARNPRNVPEAAEKAVQWRCITAAESGRS